jgi:hypothetical protein
MRISEILREGDPQRDPSVLITTLELLRNHADDNETAPVLSTENLFKLMKNSGAMFDYDSLVHAYKTEPAVKELIKSFNKDTITLRTDSADEFSMDSDGANMDLGTDTVARMAHKALAKRD